MTGGQILVRQKLPFFFNTFSHFLSGHCLNTAKLDCLTCFICHVLNEWQKVALKAALIRITKNCAQK